MNRRKGFISIISAWLLSTFFAQALADSVTFNGSSIALKNIKIQSLQSGKINYTDSSGQRQSRPLDDVLAIGFDGFPELDEAEQALAKADREAGLKGLLRAMLAADTDLEKLWVHARLARVHDLRKEYVQAAGHAAAAMLLSADSYWRSLEPVCTPKQAAYGAVKESYENLQAAKAKVKVAELSASIARMMKVIQPLHEALAKEYKGEPIAAGSTVSGFTRGEILGDGMESPAQKPASAAPQARSPAVAAASDTKPPRPSANPPASVNSNGLAAADLDPRSATTLQSLLNARRFDDALKLCRQVEQDPGQRDLGQFLHQFGLALQGSGQPRDAAVMLLRSAVLYPGNPDAPECLIVCAEIHQREFKNIDTARRLLNRAVELAEALDLPEASTKARQALQSLPSSATSKEQ